MTDQGEETAQEAADAAARSGSPAAGIPDDAISRAAARVGADREESVDGTGTNADAPDSTEPESDREVSERGDTDRWA